VQLDHSFAGQVEGLCGDFNGNAENDFEHLSSGLIASTSQEFGGFWKTSKSCPDVEMTTTEYDPCGVRFVVISYDIPHN